MTDSEDKDYYRWKARRENQISSGEKTKVYTPRELFLNDLDSSAQNGFVSSASLDSFIYEIDSYYEE